MRAMSDVVKGEVRTTLEGIDYASYYQECEAAMSISRFAQHLKPTEAPIAKSQDEGAMVFGGDYQ